MACGSTPRRPSQRPHPLPWYSTSATIGGRRTAQYFHLRNQLLEQFQSPGIKEWLSRDPNFLIEPMRQDAAVVFVDLSGFTSLSEKLEPDAIRELLKDFHALVDEERSDTAV